MCPDSLRKDSDPEMDLDLVADGEKPGDLVGGSGDADGTAETGLVVMVT